MPSHWLIRYYWGFLLPSICKAWGLDKEACPVLHEAFKQAFDIETTTFLDEADFLNYVDSIHGLLVTEFGIMVPHINEPPNVDEIDMETFLTLYK
jgi:Ca2+-binding EF-hand superfamily protein